MTPQEALGVWAHRWTALRAWGRPLTEVAILIKPRKGSSSTGTAWPLFRRTTIRQGQDVPDALEAVLHELAHLAAPGTAHHGEAFKQRLADAVAEVTGTRPPTEGSYEILDRVCAELIRSWWTQTGQALAWDLVVTEED